MENSTDVIELLKTPTKLRGNEKTLKFVQDFVRDNPGKYDRSLIQKMKIIGMKRPDWIPREEWTLSKRKMDTQGEFVARLAAYGMKASDIAEKMSLQLSTIDNYLRDPNIKNRIYEIQEKTFGGNPRTLFRTALNEAFATELELMRSSSKDTVKLSAAQDIMDRAVGKATQEINVNDSNIRNLIERLEKMERIGGFSAIDVPSQNISDAEFAEVRDNQVEPVTKQDAVILDPVDKWLKENETCLNGSTGKSP